ncbi:MBL fold metallo-hydrolase [Oceanobacillus piezotolerans]|uniref:MBL fold metallo-hydrolase n=1 Tax=Oceanobacillus piezotolerans TaxID=2448030 RepID=A0A498D8N4_9BACI|nr:MBL fold metallo-hydrolase [Oceanobacillus piezotolerans]RLL47075.1 MBL fold metallo-hydrolase [Oceanobacillus piezotolerans]
MKRWISFLFILIFVFPAGIYADSNPPMRVHFIDVGHGDSVLIETPKGQSILIDGGQPDAGPKLVEYLKQTNVEEIDLMVATHPHFDHIGGLIEVMKNFPVKQLIDNGRADSTRTYAAYLWVILREEIPVKTAKEKERLQLDDKLDIQVLNAGGDIESNNQSSVVLKVSYDEIDFLFMSDVEAEQEEDIRRKYDVEAEIFKAAHHGFSSSSMKFLKEVNSQAAVITYSQANGYGNPEDRVIKNLGKLKTQIYSTAKSGNVVVETNGKEYSVMPEFEPWIEMER